MNKKVELIIGEYPNQVSLDLETESVSIALQYSIDDVRNIDKKNTNYSKTITLPGTKKNNLAFGNLFDINSTFDQFNPNLKTKARIVIDSSPVLEGYLQLRGVKKLNNADLQGNKISYQAVVFDDSIDFMQAIGDKLVSDLDFSDYDHAYSKDSIEAAWDNDYTGVYQYPLLDKLSSDYAYKVTDFKPCFYHKALLLKIAERAGDKIDEDGNIIEGEGYKLEGSFIESNDDIDSNASRYEKEIIGWDGNTPKIPTSDAISREFKAGLTDTQTTLFTVLKQGPHWNSLDAKGAVNYDDTSSASGFYDNGGNYDTPVTIDGDPAATYTAPRTGKYTFNVTQNFEIDYSAGEACIMRKFGSGATLDGTYGNNPPILKIGARLRYKDTGEQLAGATSTVAFGTFDAFTSAGTKTVGPGDRFFTFENIKVERDREVYIEYNLSTDKQFRWSNSSNPIVGVYVDFKLNRTLDGSSGELSRWENTTILENNIEEGDDVEVSQYLPAKIKQKDIILDLVKRHNLYIVKHPIKPRTLLLQTRDEYYNNNVSVLDWTQKKDFSSEDDVKFLSDLQNKEILFTYKEESGVEDAKGERLGDSYTKSTGDIYGQKKISFENEFVSGVKKIESIFSAPLLVQRDVVVIPGIKSTEDKRNPSLLYWGGKTDTSDSYIQIDFNSGSEIYFEYPYAGHYDNPSNPTYDVHYGEVTAEYYPIASKSITDNNLFNRHWRNYYNQITTGKLVTSKFDLNETDVNFIKDNLNSRIFVKDSYYHINKIVDYKPLENGLTTVELLKIDKGSDFTPELIGSNVSLFSSSDATFRRSNNSIGPFSTSLYNNVNSTDVVVLGRRNYVATSSSGIVNGDDNEIGANSRSLSVTGNSNFVDSGTSNVTVTGSNNVVEAGLENVTITGDGITVTESNTTVINETIISETTTSIGGFWESGSTVGADYSVVAINNTFPSTATGSGSLVTGNNNTATGDYNAILGGADHVVNGYLSATVGGWKNTIDLSSVNSVAVGGYFNNLTGIGHDTLIGSRESELAKPYSVIIGGEKNTITSTSPSITGEVETDRGCVIIGGKTNEIEGTVGQGAIIGGMDNTLETTASRSVILGGQNITGAQEDAVYVPNLVFNPTIVPTSSTDTAGEEGQISHDTTHIHFKTSAGWGKVPLTYGTTTDLWEAGTGTDSIQSVHSTNPNTVSGTDSIAIGNNNTVEHNESIVISVGGLGGSLTGAGSIGNSIIGGFNHSIAAPANFNSILGGTNNKIEDASAFNSIVGGGNNEVKGASSFSGITLSENSRLNQGSLSSILGASSSEINTGSSSTILGGGINSINRTSYATILGGQSNSIGDPLSTSPTNGSYNSILGGSNHTIEASTTTGNEGNVIIGGDSNTIEDTVNRSTILGGENITATQDDTVYVPSIAFGNEDTRWKFIELEIGSWDMDADLSTSVTHTLSATEWKTVRNIEAMILNDADSEITTLTSGGGVTGLNSSFMFFTRSASGYFDSTDYDDSAINRGFVTFWYKPD